MTIIVIKRVDGVNSSNNVHNIKNVKLLLTLTFLLVSGCMSNSTEPITEIQNTKLLFTSYNNTTSKLFVCDVDGTNIIQITNDDIGAYSPQFLPSGDKIVYQVNVYYPARNTISPEIFTMDLNTGTQINISNNSSKDYNLDISPDGNFIVYVSPEVIDSMWISNTQVYRVNIDGSNKINLSNNKYYENDPSVSPFGNKIYFISYMTDIPQLLSMDINGNNRIAITDTLTHIMSTNEPYDISPDGTKIVFTAWDINDNSSGANLYLIDEDGKNKLRLTNNAGLDQRPRFSSDGKKIIYSHAWNLPTNYGGEIRIINIDGSNMETIASGNYASAPLATNDGTYVFYTVSINNRIQIMRVNLKSKKVIQITENSFSNVLSDIFP